MYFYLRKVTKSGKCLQFSLGSHYHFCLRNRPEDKHEFELIKGDGDFEGLQGYIVSGCPENNSIPIWEGHKYFIMTSTGDTIDSITDIGNNKGTRPKPVDKLSDEELINAMHDLYANAGIDREYEMFYIPAERNLRSALNLPILDDLMQENEAQRKYITEFFTHGKVR